MVRTLRAGLGMDTDGHGREAPGQGAEEGQVHVEGGTTRRHRRLLGPAALLGTYAATRPRGCRRRSLSSGAERCRFLDMNSIFCAA